MAVMRRSLRERIYLTFRLVILANCFGEKNILEKKKDKKNGGKVNSVGQKKKKEGNLLKFHISKYYCYGLL